MTALVYPTRDELLTLARGLHGSPADRLARAYVIETNGCWRWIKGRTTGGYGHFSIRGVYYQAHLLAYILHVGPVPAGLQPDHLCRNRWCVNPADIEFVTAAENIRRGAGARLTASQVAQIRSARRDGEGTRALGRRYGVNHSTISRLVRGLTWTDRPAQVDVAA
jgi:hypothetical protein